MKIIDTTITLWSITKTSSESISCVSWIYGCYVYDKSVLSDWEFKDQTVNNSTVSLS